ncbi:hypothetical protein LJR219_000964 [Phenylobacterium sp. LjRoot219]
MAIAFVVIVSDFAKRSRKISACSPALFYGIVLPKLGERDGSAVDVAISAKVGGGGLVCIDGVIIRLQLTQQFGIAYWGLPRILYRYEDVRVEEVSGQPELQ